MTQEEYDGYLRVIAMSASQAQELVRLEPRVSQGCEPVDLGLANTGGPHRPGARVWGFKLPLTLSDRRAEQRVRAPEEFEFGRALLDVIAEGSTASAALAGAVRERDVRRDTELVQLCAEKLRERRYRGAADALLEMMRSDELR